MQAPVLDTLDVQEAVHYGNSLLSGKDCGDKHLNGTAPPLGETMYFSDESGPKESQEEEMDTSGIISALENGGDNAMDSTIDG